MSDASATIAHRLGKFNRGGDPQMLKLKYQEMQASVFGFYRGTCHLFYEDWHEDVPTESLLNLAPPAWICGDLHLENFGSYKGDNRLVYFDMNDFDEAVLAPCTWDVARFLTSVLVGISAMQITERRAGKLCQTFLDAYSATLIKGHVRSFERATATGLIRTLLDTLKQRKRTTFLSAHTDEDTGVRRLRIDGKHFLSISKKERALVIGTLKAWAKKQPNSGFYKVLDVAHRVAGTGSLGIDRYVVLIEGNKSPNKNFLLDLKAETASSLQPYLTLAQPPWENEAHRVVSIQERVQAVPPAVLSSLRMHDTSYLLHELQPMQDRVNLADKAGKPEQLNDLITSMAEIVAWGQLRSSGRQGSATADAFITFAQVTDWHKPLLDYVHAYRHRVQADYEAFCHALDTGKLKARLSD